MIAATTRLTQALPQLSGREAELAELTQSTAPIFLPRTKLDLSTIQSGFACALHMHQPTIPAGTDGSLISNLQNMFEHPHDGDNHNAAVFADCYGRMGDFIPQLIDQGCTPRIQLDYSGNLLWGLAQMGRQDVLDKLRRLTCDDRYWPHVEWLGTLWSHAVVPSTPVPDIKLHIQAWQHHFAALFGDAALSRVKGFSPPEMHLPNHPDVLYEYIKALKDCGYRWLLVQEDSVERLDGCRLHQADKYLPNRLLARNSSGETISITALIKTQGSDTKLVAQMQPYFEAKNWGRQRLGPVEVPSLVSQIADGENGGVMMNEYPRDVFRVYQEMRDALRQAPEDGGNSQTVALNGTEYLELIEAAGANPDDYPVCQAVQQHKLWQWFEAQGEASEATGVDLTTNEGSKTDNRVEAAIRSLRAADPSFTLDGASWTNDLSWVAGYENVLEPMKDLSARFHQRYDTLVDQNPEIKASEGYQSSLLHLLLLQTSCFRYWGQGTWTDYAQELYRRGLAALER